MSDRIIYPLIYPNSTKPDVNKLSISEDLILGDLNNGSTSHRRFKI